MENLGDRARQSNVIGIFVVSPIVGPRPAFTETAVICLPKKDRGLFWEP